ncbi:MAG: HAD family hydrolase [Rhodospirillales bacterium]|nr:HAD family hydrolase [Rhodospirillales bacterium]
MIQQPKAVFFDWDGTLVDTLPWLLTAHNHVRSALGYEPWTAEEFKKIIRYSSRELYGQLYGEQESRAHDLLTAYMEAHHLDNLHVLADVRPMLEYLNDMGIPTGIVSNKRHSFLIREVSHLGWDPLFRILIGAGFTKKDKPAAEPLLKALESCDLQPGADIWYIGDSETDMLTAQAAGCSAALIRHHHDNEHLIETYSPTYVLDNCGDLLNLLRKSVLAA